MPIINIKMLEGRTIEQKRELVKKVTEAVAQTTGTPAERVSIIIEEMPKHHYASGGILTSDK